MAYLDALRLAASVKHRLVNFAVDDAFLRDDTLREICREIWNGRSDEGGLVSDLWVEGAFPARQSSESLGELARTGRFERSLCDHLNSVGEVPSDRPLFTHQLEAIIAAQERLYECWRPAIVVTAPTGAGKTESFLLPVLHELATLQPAVSGGARCIILYPMNALVNDQVDRLDRWLSGQDRVSFFHFTSETPENNYYANKQGIEPYPGVSRFRTRQQARGLETREGQAIEGGPIPDIVVTNYSMLEYMLCRPQDSGFFGPNLCALVLDEAHLYTGTLAAEIALLLRRLLVRCGRTSEEVLQFATSATIGSGKPGELEAFAAQLFTRRAEHVRVIRGEQDRTAFPLSRPPAVPLAPGNLQQAAWPDDSTIRLDPEGNPSLVQDGLICARLEPLLTALVGHDVVSEARIGARGYPAALLRAALQYAPILQRAYEILAEQRHLPLRDLARELWRNDGQDSLRATLLLLRLGASARDKVGDYPLLPHRIHLLAKPADSLTVCLNTDCTGPPSRRVSGIGCISGFDNDRCAYCRSVTLTLLRCPRCGMAALGGSGNSAAISALPANIRTAERCRGGSVYMWHTVQDGDRCHVDAGTGAVTGVGGGGTPLWQIDACPNCGKESAAKNFVTFGDVQGGSLALAIVAETALYEQPVYPGGSAGYLPARGRRLLTFSDSRSEAARLGPRLRAQHETQLVRAALVREVAGSPVADAAVLARRQKRIDSLRADLSDPAITTAERADIEREIRRQESALGEMQAGGAVSVWVDHLAKSPLIRELMDPETAEHHAAAKWSIQQWEANAQAVRRRIGSLIARELARPAPFQTTAETVGLVEVAYPGLDEIEPPEWIEHHQKDVRTALEVAWTGLLASLLDTLRVDGAITLGSDDEDADYPYGDPLIGRWCARDTSPHSGIVRFNGDPTRQGSRLSARLRFVLQVLRSAGLPNVTPQDAFALLNEVFDSLIETARADRLSWLTYASTAWSGASLDTFRIHFPDLALRQPQDLHACPVTGLMFSRAVLKQAPAPARAPVTPVTPEEADQHIRYGRIRRELKDSPVFEIGLWAEEHSAQLDPKENRRLQDLFRAGIRGLLSSTTTLELGIDIGGLSGVLMGNVPPGKANYLQRAGRAGRRADGSSAVVTFARPRPFDREVFYRFGDFLKRDLRTPRVLLERERIVRRHAHAALLGEFFRAIRPPGAKAGAMTAYGKMGAFCGELSAEPWKRDRAKPTLQPSPVPAAPAQRPIWWHSEDHKSLAERFIEYLVWAEDQGQPVLRPMLHRLLSGTPIAPELDHWANFFQTIQRRFMDSVNGWLGDYASLVDGWNALDPTAPGAIPQSHAIRYQMDALYDTTVIESFANQQFLPRYGFPIGVQRLKVIVPVEGKKERVREEDQFRLDRGGLLALREYAPGSELIARGKTVRSHGLLKHWTGATVDSYVGLHSWYARCHNEHIFYSLEPPERCPYCMQEPEGPPSRLLFPRHGFTTAAWDRPRYLPNPSVERAGEVELVAHQAIADSVPEYEWKNFGDVQGLLATYREDGEILVYNAGEKELGFVICVQCGYACSETVAGGEGRTCLPREFEEHAPLRSIHRTTRCPRGDSATPLRYRTLAAREITDVARIDLSGCPTANITTSAEIETLGHALKMAGTRLLELDSRELGVLLVPTGPAGRSWGIAIYDNCPGGAGHVKELLDLGREWLKAGLQALFVTQDHHNRCEHACLDCLLTFDTQMRAAAGLLHRREAYNLLQQLLECKEPDVDSGPRLHTPDQVQTAVPSNEERLQRNLARIAKRPRGSSH